MIDLWHRIRQHDTIRRTLVLLMICVSLYLIRNIMSLILLTFILTYLMVRGINSIHHLTKIPKKLCALLVYAVLIVFLYVSITRYLPVLFLQTIQMIEDVVAFYQKLDTDNTIYQWVVSNVSIKEIGQQLTTGARVLLTTLTSIGSMGITFFMSLILSFFFVIEKEWVTEFAQAFYDSKISTLSKDVGYLGSKFVNTFGVVIEAQVIIAIVNTFLTVTGLFFMNFPNNQLLSLALMIFIFSLIPVAGVIISCVPLSLIAYTVGGVQDVIYVLIMIVLIHAIESYFLNPKLMSSKTDLPVFYVFVILLFSEKFFGIWGLVIGIPVFVFLLDLLEVKVSRHRKPHVPNLKLNK